MSVVHRDDLFKLRWEQMEMHLLPSLLDLDDGLRIVSECVKQEGLSGLSVWDNTMQIFIKINIRLYIKWL